MSGFKGQSTNSVDDKGRVAIPKGMRSCMHCEADDTFVITRGFEKCILAYPLDEWSKIEYRIAKLNPYDRKHRAFTRQFMMWAEKVKLDSKHRIRLSGPLLEYAAIDHSTLVLGNHMFIEIWDPKRFDDYLLEVNTNYESLAAEVMSP